MSQNSSSAFNASLSLQIVPEQIVPEAKRALELSERLRIIDAVIAHISDSGLNYFVGPFDTTVEGDFDALMKLLAECHHLCIAEGASSLASYIKIAFHPNRDGLGIEEKTAKFHELP